MLKNSIPQGGKEPPMSRNGIPLLARKDAAQPIALEQVQALDDEDLDAYLHPSMTTCPRTDRTEQK